MNYIIYNNVYPWTSPYAYLRFLWLRVFCLLPFLPLAFISLAPADLSFLYKTKMISLAQGN